MQLPLHEPQFDENDESYVIDCLRSTWVSTGGPYVERFERNFAEYTGAKHAVSVCNGTVGLQLALEVLAKESGIESPFEVLVPTLTFIATANAVVHAGGHPVFMDCAENSYNICPKEVFLRIRNEYRLVGTRWLSKATGRPLLAIMPVHIMGWTCDLDALSQGAAELGIAIIEDAAEALGSRTVGGGHVGHTGRAAVFSFNGNKILTVGGGGMLITDDDDFAKRAKHLATTARVDSLRYVHDEVGHNFRLINLLAALGCSQLLKLDERLVKKKRIFERYCALLADHKAVVVHAEPHTVAANHWLVNIRTRNESDREKLLTGLNAAQVQARPLWTPLHRQPAYLEGSATSQGHRDYPNADVMWRTSLSLPSSPHISDEQLSFVVGQVRNLA